MFRVQPLRLASKPIPRVGVFVVVRYKHKYLVVKRSKPPNESMWAFPGGSLKWGESTLAGAKRELFEETNLRAGDDGDDAAAGVHFFKKSQRVVECLPGTASCNSADYHYVLIQHGAVVESDAAVQSARAQDDAADILWLTREQIKEYEEHGGRMVAGTMESVAAFEEFQEFQ